MPRAIRWVVIVVLGGVLAGAVITIVQLTGGGGVGSACQRAADYHNSHPGNTARTPDDIICESGGATTH